MKPPIFSPFSSIIQTCMQTIEARAQCKTAVEDTTRQDCQSSQQFSRYRNSAPRGSAFESLPQRRSTVCPTELDRMNSPGLFSDQGLEEDKMLFEQRRVSMIPGGKPQSCRDLLGSRIHRFVSKVSDNLSFQDILWRSADFSMHTADARRRFGFPEKQRRSQEDRWGLGWISLDGHLLNAESSTSVERIGTDLSCDEAPAWVQFSPLQRVLIVAIAAAAAANFKRWVVIKLAERSLDDRDQTLNFTGRKLNYLSERISSFYDQSGLRNAGGCETCGQGFNDGSRNWNGKTGDEEKIPLDSTHAPCAVAILELKRRMGKMTEKEASNVMAAFASVLEKVESLEGTQEGRHNKAQVVAFEDLKVSVEKASAQITSLQMSLFDMWHVLLPESLCTINISPSELEHYLDKEKKESCMLLPSRQFHIQAWRQWLNIHEHASEATVIYVPQDETEEDASIKMLLTATEQEECGLSYLSDWSSSVTSSSDHDIWHPAEPSAIGAAVKRSVEKSLGKIEIASAKVAKLELQLASLKEHLKLCEKKRKHSEEKLAEAVKQVIKNQMNFAAKEEEIACSRKECKQKDATIKETTLAVQKSKNTSDKLNFAAKEGEIACLRKECKKKYATIKDITLAVQKSKDTSDKRLVILEDICKKNNAMVMRLKDDMVSLEEKVNACLGKEIKQKDANIKEITLAQKPKVTGVKRLTVSEDICKKKNAMILRLKDDMVALEEKVNACLGKEIKQKDGNIKEITLAQKSKVTGVKRLAVSEDICKKKNAAIMRFKDDIVAMEEKVSEIKRFLIPLSSKCNDEYYLPLALSYNPLFDNMVIPSSRDSPHKVFGLKTNDDQYLAANEYASSASQASQGYNETQQSSSGHASTLSPTYVKFRRNSTGTEAQKITKLGSSSPRKVKSFRNGNVLSGVDSNANLRSRRSSCDSGGLRQNTRNTQISKSKDITRRKRWM